MSIAREVAAITRLGLEVMCFMICLWSMRTCSSLIEIHRISIILNSRLVHFPLHTHMMKFKPEVTILINCVPTLCRRWLLL